jgi:hypothetical protein
MRAAPSLYQGNNPRRVAEREAPSRAMALPNDADDSGGPLPGTHLQPVAQLQPRLMHLAGQALSLAAAEACCATTYHGDSSDTVAPLLKSTELPWLAKMFGSVERGASNRGHIVSLSASVNTALEALPP